jgi:hypothetical protein
MARPCTLEDSVVVSVRMERESYRQLHDLAALETLNTGRVVSVVELIRNAVKYVYEDNERLREAFRRSRSHVNKKYR